MLSKRDRYALVSHSHTSLIMIRIHRAWMQILVWQFSALCDFPNAAPQTFSSIYVVDLDSPRADIVAIRVSSMGIPTYKHRLARAHSWLVSQTLFENSGSGIKLESLFGTFYLPLDALGESDVLGYFQLLFKEYISSVGKHVCAQRVFVPVIRTQLSRGTTGSELLYLFLLSPSCLSHCVGFNNVQRNLVTFPWESDVKTPYTLSSGVY